MSEPSRLAALPGYDTAPDVYETPDLLTDSTTASGGGGGGATRSALASSREGSETDATSEEEEDDEDDDDRSSVEDHEVGTRFGGGGGVSRRRLYPARARSRFGRESRGVRVGGVDLSDRVDGGRRGYYRGGGRKGREGEEEEEEGLEARIARLRREVEECRVEVGKEEDGKGGKKLEEGVEGLSRVLSGLEMPRRLPLPQQQEGGRQADGAGAAGTADGGGAAVVPPAQAEGEITDEQTLGRIADFDTRLAALEQALGLSSLDAATSDAVITPILPSLTALDHHLTALSSASNLSSLESLTHRIQTLRAEAETLHHHTTPTTNPSASSSSSTAVADPDNPTPTPVPSLPPDDLAALKSLHALLPTLQTLSPTVPATLARLRSLRTLHTSAASAAGDLEALERRQAAMEEELKGWRDGVVALEGRVREAVEGNGRNGGVVEGWVRGLEGRVEGLR